MPDKFVSCRNLLVFVEPPVKLVVSQQSLVLIVPFVAIALILKLVLSEFNVNPSDDQGQKDKRLKLTYVKLAPYSD